MGRSLSVEPCTHCTGSYMLECTKDILYNNIGKISFFGVHGTTTLASARAVQAPAL